MNNDTTRRYPRTLEQAFGPHTSKHISEDAQPMHKADKLVLLACAVVLLFCLALGVLA